MKNENNERWRRHTSLVAAALIAAVSWVPTASAVNWTGGGDGTDWEDPLNWDGDAVPGSMQWANLLDVASGVRAVTVTGTPTTVAVLAMAQSTAAATNMLTVTGTLNLNIKPTDTSRNVTFFNQTCSAPVDSLVVNLESGGLIAYGSSESTKTYEAYAYNRGIFNLNGGDFQFNTNRRYKKIFYNYGILNSTGGRILGRGDNGAAESQPMVFRNEVGGEMHLKSGTTLYGMYYSGHQTIVYLSNYGLLSLSTNAVLKINNRFNQGVAVTIQHRIYNYGSGTFRVGSANEDGGADILFTNEDGGNQTLTGGGWLYTFENAGDAAFYGESRMLARPGGPQLRSYTVSNYGTGTLDLYGNANGIQFGTDNSGVNVGFTLNNYGAMNVKVFSDAETGLVVLGNSASVGDVRIFNQTASGVMTVDPDAVLRIQSYQPQYLCKFYSQDTAKLVLGAAEQPASGGRIEFVVSANGTAGAPAFTVTSGTVTLHGTSSIERSSNVVVRTGEGAFLFNNQAAGALDLRDTSRIGNATRDMVFVNDGTLMKTNAGIAVIASAAGGSFTNSGTMVISGGGALDIQCPAATLTATSDLTFDFTDGTPSLNVTGSTLNLDGGTLHVSGDFRGRYDVLTCPSGTLTGIFDTEDVPADVSVIYTSTAVRVWRPIATTIIVR